MAADHVNLPKYAIGSKFQSRGKHPKVCIVTDILKTYNSKGELVQIRYVATHDFMGQVVTDRDVCETTIAMGQMDALQIDNYNRSKRGELIGE